MEKGTAYKIPNSVIKYSLMYFFILVLVCNDSMAVTNIFLNHFYFKVSTKGTCDSHCPTVCSYVNALHLFFLWVIFPKTPLLFMKCYLTGGMYKMSLI